MVQDTILHDLICTDAENTPNLSGAKDTPIWCIPLGGTTMSQDFRSRREKAVRSVVPWITFAPPRPPSLPPPLPLSAPAPEIESETEIEILSLSCLSSVSVSNMSDIKKTGKRWKRYSDASAKEESEEDRRGLREEDRKRGENKGGRGNGGNMEWESGWWFRQTSGDEVDIPCHSWKCRSVTLWDEKTYVKVAKKIRLLVIIRPLYVLE